MSQYASKSWFAAMIVFVLFAATEVLPQKKAACKENDPSKRMLCFFQQADWDSAISLSEKLLRLAEKADSESAKSVATAHFNVALVRKKRFQQNWSSREEMSKRKRRRFLKTLTEDSEISEKHFRKVIDLNDKETGKDELQLADARYELAWILLNDSQHSEKDYERRSSESELLYKEALEQRESLLGKNHGKTISTLFALAECYRNQLKFEESLPYYDRFVSTIDANYGRNQKLVAPALNAMSGIYFTIFEEEKSQSLRERASSLLGVKAENPKAEYVLNNRLSDYQKKKNRETDSYVSLNAITSSLGWNDRHNRFTEEKLKRIPIRVVIDEEGRVIDADSDVKDDTLTVEAIRDVRKWMFRPLVIEGDKHKMRGIVIFAKWVTL